MRTILLSGVLSLCCFVLTASAQAPPPGGEPLPPRATPGPLPQRDPLPPREPGPLRPREPLPPRADPDSRPGAPAPLPPVKVPAARTEPAPAVPVLGAEARVRVADLLLGLRRPVVTGATVAAADVVDVRRAGVLTQAELDALAQALHRDVTARREATRLTRQLRERGLLARSQAVVGVRDGKVYVYTIPPVAR